MYPKTLLYGTQLKHLTSSPFRANSARCISIATNTLFGTVLAVEKHSHELELELDTTTSDRICSRSLPAVPPAGRPLSRPLPCPPRTSLPGRFARRSPGRRAGPRASLGDAPTFGSVTWGRFVSFRSVSFEDARFKQRMGTTFSCVRDERSSSHSSRTKRASKSLGSTTTVPQCARSDQPLQFSSPSPTTAPIRQRIHDTRRSQTSTHFPKSVSASYVLEAAIVHT